MQKKVIYLNEFVEFFGKFFLLMKKNNNDKVKVVFLRKFLNKDTDQSILKNSTTKVI
jgi:hypothetical protein